MRSLDPVLPVVALAAFPSLALGQTVLLQVDGTEWYARLGSSVARVGDVDGDGFDDVLVGSPFSDHAGASAGKATVFSGRTEAVLFVAYGNPYSIFGAKVSGAGDVDGDGQTDWIVSAYQDDTVATDAGRVTVFSGATGGVLHVLYGEAAGEYFGQSIGAAGDVDGDGFDDVIVGTPRAASHGPYTGRAQVFSGATGQELFRLEGQASHDQIGWCVNGLGDVDGDGRDDFGIAADDDLELFSGATGTVLRVLPGGSFVTVGDLDADGHADQLVSEAQWTRLYSGADGSQVRKHKSEWTPSGSTALIPAGGGDVDGDGWLDYAISTRWLDPYSSLPAVSVVRVFSGFSGKLLWELPGDPLEGYGKALDFAGDVDADGLTDLLIGTPYAGSKSVGSVTAVGFRFATRVDCTGEPNSTGQNATLDVQGSLVTTDNDVTLATSQLPLHVTLYFLASRITDHVPMAGGSQGTLCLHAPIGRFVGPGQVLSSGPSGAAQLAIDLTQHPTPSGPVAVQAGETWHYQAWYRDKVGTLQTSNFSDGLAVHYR